MSESITIDEVQRLITRAPFHQWLGIEVTALHDDGIELKAKWREEWVVNPDRRYTHGGILAALIDLAADWALVKRTGRGVPTIDHARGLSCRRHAGRTDGEGPRRESRRPVLHAPKPIVYDACRQIARKRPRNLFHRTAKMTVPKSELSSSVFGGGGPRSGGGGASEASHTNLGDLIRQRTRSGQNRNH